MSELIDYNISINHLIEDWNLLVKECGEDASN
jgi:hypothetical protein